MKGFLEEAVADARKDVARLRSGSPARELLAGARYPQGGRFLEAVSRADRVNVIAECKRRSPSRGTLREPYDAAALARAYADHGAAAISVLTEARHFGGSLDDLRTVRAAVPKALLLRKDFLVDPYQIAESAAAGADAVLLIAAALKTPDLHALREAARDLGLAALVEVHDGRELGRALEAGAEIVGVNARDLTTLEVRQERALELADAIPDTCVAVAESGLRRPEDVTRRRDAGYDAFLIGEHLLTQEDPGAALAELLAGVPSAAGGTR